MHKGFIYKHTHTNYISFILHLYQNKKKYPKITKLLLNSLYGKLAQNYSLSNPNPLSIVAAAITSYARIYMFIKTNHTNNPLIYSDTDSLFNQHPINTPAHPTKIGLPKNTINKKHKNPFLSVIKIKKKKTYKYLHNKITTNKGLNYPSPIYKHTHTIYINNTPIINLQLKKEFYKFYNYKTNQLKLPYNPKYSPPTKISPLTTISTTII